MIKKSIKRLLVIGALSMVIPVLGTAQRWDNNGGGCGEGNGRHNGKKCQAVPEGGSTTTLLLAVGATCAGAMLVRSRLSKRSLS